MKRDVKHQIDSILDLIGEVHKKINQSLAAGNVHETLLLLENCQQAAIAVGEAIENAEGEGNPVIPLLESYCELIYQMHEELFSGASAEAQGVGELAKAYHAIESSIKEHIQIRTEVVFLPYKASMWDSLESVWRAADADPDCDAYVVPIPYYDKNPDGSVKQWHYEGDMYPEDVPIVHYEKYDFNRRPDMIFIHNPYDQYNYVTSVHPVFYSQELKKYTDKLIYIPYFVLDEIDPDNSAAVEAIDHLIQVRGVFNADVVVVQSEKMRQCYIKSLVKVGGEQSRKIWENKIRGLGSPKFDKVADVKAADIDLPDTWKEHIVRSDGSRKKVILYNTGVTAILQDTDRMIRKMERVFAFFKENQEDAALLWRPHPLIGATMKSMRPQLWQQYRRLVEWYQAENFGIYDDSAQLERAIALSDAYYGDSSSVVQLCQSVGIPVMIQNVGI